MVWIKHVPWGPLKERIVQTQCGNITDTMKRIYFITFSIFRWEYQRCIRVGRWSILGFNQNEKVRIFKWSLLVMLFEGGGLKGKCSKIVRGAFGAVNFTLLHHEMDFYCIFGPVLSQLCPNWVKMGLHAIFWIWFKRRLRRC